MELVKNEIDMVSVKCLAAILAVSLSASLAGAQNYDFSWKRTEMDGSRTGVTFASADNVRQAMGEVKGGRYFAPDGRVFRRGVTRKVAKVMIDVQPEMAEVKQVVAWSPEAMIKTAPECALSDWSIDLLISKCAEITGKKVDVGFANFGGIRVDMPKGDVLLDDVMSMFPFRNKLCYLELSGKDVRAILEQMASSGWQVIGGVRCLSTKDGKLVSAEVNGEPLDDGNTYGVATIDFLLNGGDGYFIGRNAREIDVLDKYIIDVVLPYVRQLTAEGKPLEYKADGRVKIVE